MRTTRAYLTVLACFIGLLVIAFFVGYTKPAKLGLDLQGGLEVVLQAQPQSGKKLTSDDITQAVSIIRNRVDSSGTKEPQIRPQGTDQILVQIPGKQQDATKTVALISAQANLRFYDFNNTLQGGKSYRDAYLLLQKSQNLIKSDTTPDTYYLFDASHKVVAGPASTQQQLLATFSGKLPTGDKALGVPNGYLLAHGQQANVPVDNEDTTGHIDPKYGLWVLLKDKPSLAGKEIKSAQADTDSSGWVTSIIFTGKGSKDWTNLTRKLAQAGELDQTLHPLSIVLDNEIVSSPTVDYRQYPDGLPGGQSEITGLGSQSKASQLAIQLSDGALPVRFDVLETNQVSATLGKQSLRQGLLAGGIGLLIVMAYLIVFYRFLGLIADLALVSYALLFYAVIVGYPVVMTLPGIAGMILTIGVAADANIVIFERIREEYRAGRTIRASITAGYSKGLATIIDANVVTLITAFLLFLISTGEVKGFALLLGVGVVLSMFTAVAATFAMLGLLSMIPFFRHPQVIGAKRKPSRFHIPWMRGRNAMFVWTALVMLTSIGGLAFKGLNLGIDFKSGTQISLTTTDHPSVKQIVSAMNKVDSSYGDATVQTISQPSGTSKAAAGHQYTIQIRKVKGGAAGDQTIQNALGNDFQVKQYSSQTIGATFGHQILEGAVIALILSFALEVLYIWSRFELKFAIPVFIALAHDLLVALGAYAFTGREFNSSTVAALLTILGYSLYDTIIVFDRVRENVHLLRKSSYQRIVDVSLNEVLTRSINTSIVTLLPVATIFFFGGSTLTDFAYALMIGIFAGAYSSLIVASPILSWIKEREPAWKRRIGTEEELVVPAGVLAQNTVVDQADPANGGSSVPRTRSRKTEVVEVDDPDADLRSTDDPVIGSTPAQRRKDRRSRSQRKS